MFLSPPVHRRRFMDAKAQARRGAGGSRAADQRAIDAERSAADADQGAADDDQTASDADQTAAERDDADAASDQAASEEDQASADRQLPVDAGGAALEAYEASRVTREASAISRHATHVARARIARSRVKTAAGRDATATARDAAARRRDIRAQAMDRSIAISDSPLAEKLEQVRTRAAADRAKAAEDRAAAARERAHLEAELDSAHVDDLTGALRRETGWLALAHEIDRAQRGDGHFVVAFVDVDGLKRINDRDAHAAGDQVLRTLVSTLRSNLRSFDPIVRYGGDEFVCGLGGADLDQVKRRFDAIGRSVQDDVGVGISVGLAALTAGETVDQLTARADAALLDARKRRGE
jgi:diguanylate cyclase (GGDEF)-like protein